MSLLDLKTLSLIGLSRKAGKLILGDVGVEGAIRSKHPKLVIIAGDAAENTIRKYKNLCLRKDVPYVIRSSKKELGKAVGRSESALIAVMDSNFSRALKTQMNAGH